jgi:putative phosphoesterase
MSSPANIESMPPDTDRHTIGLISDTHGLLRPSVHSALEGVELILHAGDVGGDEILHELGAIAPVLAVQGNTDPAGHPALPPMQMLEIGGLRIHVSHGDELGVPTPAKLLAAYKADVIVYGHTHKPLVERSGDRLVVNPGSAGARRFKLTPSVARLTITDGFAEVEIIDTA